MTSRYVIRPKADQDLEEQAYFYASRVNPELGHRFLIAAHETFALLATQPGIGWLPRLKHPKLKSVRVFKITGFERIIVLYRPGQAQIDILRVVHGSRDLQRLLRREGLGDQ